MDRRQLLKSGAGVVTVAGAGLLEEGCAHQPATEATPLPDPRIVDRVVTNMDRRLAWIDRHELPAEMAPPLPENATPEQRARAQQMDRLFRQSMRTLYLTGRFIDLPDEIKTHPDVQARVLDAQAEMDEAVFGMTELLGSLRPEDHRALQATLRAQPELGERLAKVMDGPAQDDGIPFRRRMSVRTTTTGLADRMKAQSPALTIDPVVRRVRRLTSQPDGGTGTARLAAAKMGEEAFWQHQDHLARLSARWERQLAQAAPQPYDAPAGAAPAAAPAAPTHAAAPAEPAPLWPARPSPAGTPAPAPAPPTRGHRVVSKGGYVMGYGAMSLGIGLVFAGLNAAFDTEIFLWPALIFGVTVGPILLIIGLIIVIVGGIMIAAE